MASKKTVTKKKVTKKVAASKVTKKTVSKSAAQVLSEKVEKCIKDAKQGDADAQHRLGRMYMDGDGVQENQSEAMTWICKAAEQGQPWAEFEMLIQSMDMHLDGKKPISEVTKWILLCIKSPELEVRKQTKKMVDSLKK